MSTDDLAFLRPGVSADAAAAWVESCGPPVVLVTDGNRAVTVHVRGRSHEVATRRVNVVDTVGAGDTFGGAFLACLVRAAGGRATTGDEAAILRAAQFAVRASAIACERAGANPPTLAELGGWP